MRRRLLKELSVVGLWDMVLALSTLWTDDDSKVTSVIHFVHISLFGLALFFILMSVLVALVSLRILAQWQRMELKLQVSPAFFSLRRMILSLIKAI